MANITTTVPNLIQGVSQQPSSIRFAGQCEEQINAFSSVTRGLIKRPPCRLIKNISDIAREGDFIYHINRSADERYVAILETRTDPSNNGTLHIYNLNDGTEATINGATGGASLSNDYLVNTTPATSFNKFKGISLGDSSFFLNTDVTVAKTTDVSDAQETAKSLVFVKQGDYEKDYTIRIYKEGEDLSAASFSVTFRKTRVFRTDVWRVNTITLVSGGTGYSVDEPISLDWGDYTWNRGAPAFNFDIDSSTGAITSVSIVSSGESTVSRDTTIAYPIQALPPGDEVTYTSGDSTSGANADTSVISAGLVTALRASSLDADYTFKDYGGSIQILRNDSEEYRIATIDGLANGGLGVVHREVSTITDLPAIAPDGFTIKIKGDARSEDDDYYARFEANDGLSFGEGAWVETIGYEVNTNVDSDTLPAQLVNTALNTFTFETTGWASREVGDDNTNPFPSFIGKTINNFVFFKNRLGFIYEDSLFLSAAGDLFNFFRSTVRETLDTAPIDATAIVSRVTNLQSAVTFQENLVLFGERGQFVVKGEPLSNSTITIDTVTSYDVDTTEDPVALGSSVYFPFSRGSYFGIQEFSLNATTSVYESVDISNQVPAYIEKGSIAKITGTSSMDMILVTTGGGTIYAYKYYFNGKEKVLSAWGKLQFGFDVLGIDFINSSLYITAEKNNETLLLEMNVEDLRLETDTVGGFTVHLDCLKKFDSAGDTLTIPEERVIDLGFTPSSTDQVEVVTASGNKLSVVRVEGSSAFVMANNEAMFSGLRYDMEYTFSEPVFRTGNPPTPVGVGNLQLRTGTLFFADAVKFSVKVTPYLRDTDTYTFSPNVINVTTTDSLIKEEGKFTFSIFTSAEKSSIKIVNDTPFQATFQACEFEANVHTRARRV